MTSDVPVVRYLQTWLGAILLMETKFQHMSKVYFIMFEENLAFNPFFSFYRLRPKMLRCCPRVTQPKSRKGDIEIHEYLQLVQLFQAV